VISLPKIARGNKTKIVLFVNNVSGQNFSRKNAQKSVLFPSATFDIFITQPLWL
jgi:hypothetical protein